LEVLVILLTGATGTAGSGGAAVTTADAIATLGEALGRHCEYADVPDDAAPEAVRTMGAPRARRPAWLRP
jgi:hypothetical protein